MQRDATNREPPRSRFAMTAPSSRMQELARRLVGHENRRKSSPKKSRSDAALEKLRPQLTTLTSNLGYEALLQRARALAGAPPHLDESTLLASVLTLLEAFIGEILTLQIIREIWPDVPLEDLESGGGESHEKKT